MYLYNSFQQNFSVTDKYIMFYFKVSKDTSGLTHVQFPIGAYEREENGKKIERHYGLKLHHF